MYQKLNLDRRRLLGLALAGGLGLTMATVSAPVLAAEMETIHFLIPGGAGGG